MRSNCSLIWQLAAAMVLTMPQTGLAQAEAADWWSINKQVAQDLFTRDVGQWAEELAKLPPPVTPEQMMQRFSVNVRAGHLKQARLVMDVMSDAEIRAGDLSMMADFLIARRDWSPARYFLERMPQANPALGDVFIREWSRTEDAAKIDAWLVDRIALNPEYWRPQRLRFRRDQGTADELLKEMESQVRRQPQDVELALAYVDAEAVIGDPQRLEWMGQVCRPPSAYSSFRLGKALRGAPRAAVPILEHSLKMPFTEDDAATLRAIRATMSALVLPGSEPAWEQELRYSTKKELMEALHAIGEAARAQALLEELTRLQADGLPPAGFDALAGQIQAASGARVVQKRFEDAQPENEENAGYWQRRAAYYKGRREYDQAVAAFEKALELCTSDDDPMPPRGSVMRSSVVATYTAFLRHAGRDEAAVRLIEDELREAKPGGPYAQRIMDIIVHGPLVKSVDRELVWTYVSSRPQWKRLEELVVWRLLADTGEEQEKSWQRAEGLAREGHFSRALVLGWVMTRCNASVRAIAWLKSARERLEEQEAQEYATFTLFEAYLDVGDWRWAEQLWPAARKRLTHMELPAWLSRIALAAARAGEPAEAVRLWSQRTNLDRARTEYVEDMVRAGLREELLDFYRSLAQRDPQCQSIAPVVQLIESVEN